MQNSTGKDKLFKRLMILTVSIFFLPFLMWALTGSVAGVFAIGWLGPWLAIQLFVSAKRSYRQFRPYWLPVVLLLTVSLFLGVAVAGFLANSQIHLLEIAVDAAVMGLFCYIFCGFFSIFSFDS